MDRGSVTRRLAAYLEYARRHDARKYRTGVALGR